VIVPSATRVLIADIVHRLRWRAPVLLGLMGLNNLVEGLGLILLFPLLAQLGMGGTGSANVLGLAVARFFQVLGIRESIGAVLAFIVVVFAAQNALFLAQSWLSALWQQSYVGSWRITLFEAIERARWRFFVERRASDLIAVLISETQRLSDALFLLGQIAANGIFLAVFLAIAFAAAWPIALVIGVFAVFMFAVARPLMRRGYGAAGQLTHRMAALQGLAGEFLAGAKLVKATASEEAAIAAFSGAVRRDVQLVRSLLYLPSLTRAIYEMCAISLLAICLWFGIVVLGIDAASIMVSLYLFLRIYQRQSVMQQSLQALQNHVPAILVVKNLLREATAEAEPWDGPTSIDARPVPEEGGKVSVSLSKVTVRHGDAAALSDVSLTIPAGSLFGIAGPSGSGKSTLVDCIIGLVELESGSIDIGGRPLAAIPIRRWRPMVGYIAQDTFLFNASIRDNIRWGHAQASDADIERAARQAHADGFIRSLPHGYDMEVGDRGVRLSGGERQRIGLARALVGPVRLLVLDEATSALDAESEREVLNAIVKLKGSITIIMISHRLSTLREADRIGLLEKGRLLELGTWDELQKSGSRFHELWRLQSADHQTMMT